MQDGSCSNVNKWTPDMLGPETMGYNRLQKPSNQNIHVGSIVHCLPISIQHISRKYTCKNWTTPLWCHSANHIALIGYYRTGCNWYYTIKQNQHLPFRCVAHWLSWFKNCTHVYTSHVTVLDRNRICDQLSKNPALSANILCTKWGQSFFLLLVSIVQPGTPWKWGFRPSLASYALCSVVRD